MQLTYRQLQCGQLGELFQKQRPQKHLPCFVSTDQQGRRSEQRRYRFHSQRQSLAEGEPSSILFHYASVAPVFQRLYSSCRLMLQLKNRLAWPAVRKLGTTWLRSQCRRSMASRADTMKRKSLPSRSIHLRCHIDPGTAGDRVLLQAKGKGAFMTKKLHLESTTPFQAGSVKHADIIGKRSRDIVITSKGLDVRAYLPSLAEYTTLTPRMVTPVRVVS